MRVNIERAVKMIGAITGSHPERMERYELD
jgi:hypothetical protein